MKRTPLARVSAKGAETGKRTTLRAVPPPDRSGEPGYREWHEPISGPCACCGQRGRLERHHVIAEQHVRAAKGWAWDLRNSLELGRYCRCHRRHTSATKRLPVSLVRAEAIEFAIELLGAARADDYLDRYYAPG